MEFQISKNRIVSGINLVKQAVANRTTKPILKTILVKVEEPWVILRATNTQIFIEVKVRPESIQSHGECCVDSLITNLLPTFEDGRYEDGKLVNPVKFSLNEGKLTVRQGRRKHQPVYFPPDEFPVKPELDGYNDLTHEDRINLIQAFQRLNVSIGVTEDRRILQGFNINPHLNYIISGDGTRTTLRENITVSGNIATLPARLVMPILSNLSSLSESDKIKIKIGSPVSGFKVEQYSSENLISEWEIIVNCLEGEFPEKPLTLIRETREAQPKLVVKTKKEKLRQILEICKVYSDRAYNEGSKAFYAVLEKVEDNPEDMLDSPVTISMNVPDLVKMDEPLVCESEGDTLRFLFHPGMMLEALNEVKTEDVELRFFGEKKPFLVLDGSNFCYLQAPMVDKRNDTSG